MQKEDSDNLSDFPKGIQVSSKNTLKNQILYIDEYLDIKAIWLCL